MLDTSLLNVADRSYVMSRYPEGQKPLLIDRLLAVGRFINILEELEARERVRITSAALEKMCPPVMQTVREGVQEEIELIKSSDAWQQQEY